MIDLRKDNLPSWVECDGRLYKLQTSFRIWIEFERRIREEGVAWAGVFEADVPDSDNWVEGVLEFFKSPNATPKEKREADTARAIDLILDGEMIVAAFQQAYGIDLTSDDMHWHRFKALLRCLPDDTMLREIAGYRTYRKPPKGGKDAHDAQMREKREEWKLPDPAREAQVEELQEWANEFFN